MRTVVLPEDLRGEWIWCPETPAEKEKYVFFRRDFSLDEMPAEAELLITARTHFQVFVNGRHLAFGPPVHPRPDHAYVCRFDVAYLLETGQNALAVLAYNTSAARLAGRRQPGGLWAQLQVDGKPLLWTNGSWRMLPGDGFAHNRPRRAFGGGFSEKIDFHVFPTGWEGRSYNAVRWRTPETRDTHAAGGTVTLVPLNLPELTCARRSPARLVARGVAQPEAAAAYVSFQSLVCQRGPGVYAAETYVYASMDATVDFRLHADTPFKCLCNGQCVKERGVVQMPAGTDLDFASALCSRASQPSEPDGQLRLREGWNHLIVCQLVETETPGFTLVLPSLAPDEVQFFRGQEDDALPGWWLAGPLRAPLANVTGSLHLGDLRLFPYHSALVAPVDEGAFLTSYRFSPGEAVAASPDANADDDPENLPGTFDLRQGEYAVFDFGQIVHGCATLLLQGGDGDQVDVLYGESLDNGSLLPFQEGRLNVDSMVLGPDPAPWLSCAPRGARYLMVFVRSARQTVQLLGVPVMVRRVYAEETPVGFRCSDETLNRIWKTGVCTLDVTVQDLLMESACKEKAQYLADAMIQALATYRVTGHFAVGAKALADFALSQIETGEMPAVCPSDSYVNIPDYALLWAVWLHQHHLHAGDEAFARSMLPHLERLLTYFRSIADPATHLLADLDVRFGAPCFLDHGDLDRRGMVTGLNALYCRALLSSAWLFTEMNRGPEAEELRALAGRIAANVRQLTWDPERHLFVDAWYEGQPSSSCSWQTNILALYGGLALPEHYAGIFGRFFSQEPPYELFTPAPTENPYFKYFVLETALALGYRRLALGLMRWYWGGMLAGGATSWWEFYSPRLAASVSGGSLCHGYGVIPSFLIPAELVGIRPARPGFSTVFFNPCTDGVREVQADVPTPHGLISVQWRQEGDDELQASITASYPLEVVPVLDPRIAANATIRVGDEVTILAAPETSE